MLKIDSIQEINSNTLISLVDYLKNVTESYRRINNPPAFISTLIFDEIYDLTCSLILLFLSINKDIEQERRRGEEKLSIIQKELDAVIVMISKLPRAQLHLISSLDTLENYKHFFEFEAV